MISSLFFAPSANAHQPLRLAKVASDLESSPVILDGTVSFAIYADFTRSKAQGKGEGRSQTRHVRFLQSAGDQLAVQYLIPDTSKMRNMRISKLPKVTITSPSGAITRVRVNERTRFSKPYLPQDYFYLSRIAADAEPGIYSISISADRSASVLVAVGSKEIAGEVLEFGSGRGLCPMPIQESDPIDQKLADQLISMREDVAELCASSNDWGYRVGERDGESFAVTMDYRFDRITVSITKGIISEVNVG